MARKETRPQACLRGRSAEYHQWLLATQSHPLMSGAWIKHLVSEMERYIHELNSAAKKSGRNHAAIASRQNTRLEATESAVSFIS